ncbi:MAG: IS1595 family transposase [Bacteroidota bacterium]
MMKEQEKFTIREFMLRFPNDDVCLDVIFQQRYGKEEFCPSCAAKTKFHRVKKRKCYACQQCGHHLYPLSGTVMERSTTPLTLWFYAIYEFSTTKNGISAKELQRKLGVTYKTAWRMGHKIRELMNDKEEVSLSGIIEIDESLIGGKAKGGKRGWGAEKKTCLFGMMERGGKVKTMPVENRKKETLLPLIKDSIEAGSTVNSDEYKGYNSLGQEGYNHKTVIHSKYQWAQEDAYTNGIEGYWSNLKKSIFGTHTWVAPKHLQNYLNEFDFRHNHRNGCQMFEEILSRL